MNTDNIKAKVSKAIITDDFVKNIKKTDTRLLVESWHTRANDEFYNILKDLKDLTDSYYEKIEMTNPFIFAMLAYCIDGNKKKTVEKTRGFIDEIPSDGALSNTAADNVVNKFIDLEFLSQEDEKNILINLNENIRLSDYYDLVLFGFDSEDYGISGTSINIDFNEKGNIIYFNTLSDKEDIKWLESTLFDNIEPKDLTLYIVDKLTNEFYPLVFFCDCENIKKNDLNEDITISFKIKDWYIGAELENKVKLIEDIKEKINNILSKN